MITEMHADHASQLIDPVWLPPGPKYLFQTVPQIDGLLLQLPIDRRLIPQGLQHRKARDHGDGIAAQRSRLVNISKWSNMLHDLFSPAKGPHRHSTPDDL